MLQAINMLDFRKRVGEVIDKTLYRKDRFLIRRKNKPVAVLVPIEDYEIFIGGDEDIEIYNTKRTKNFEKEDRLTPKEKVIAKQLLNL